MRPSVAFAMNVRGRRLMSVPLWPARKVSHPGCCVSSHCHRCGVLAARVGFGLRTRRTASASVPRRHSRLWRIRARESETDRRIGPGCLPPRSMQPTSRDGCTRDSPGKPGEHSRRDFASRYPGRPETARVRDGFFRGQAPAAVDGGVPLTIRALPRFPRYCTPVTREYSRNEGL